MSLDAALLRAQQTVPDCLAAGYVDALTGLVLGAETVEDADPDVLDRAAEATVALLEGEDDERLVLGADVLQVVLRGKKARDQVVVLVCRAGADVTGVLAEGRRALSGIEASL